MDLGLKGKVAFVAAGSKGLGKATALALAEEGANVMISSRNEEELVKTVAEIREVAKGKINYVVCDITDENEIKQAISRTLSEFGTIDILINNAGGPPAGDFEKLSDENWYHAFELNLLSYIRFIREVLPIMKEKRYGRIINFASSSVKQPIPNLLLSNTFRAGVLGLSKSLSNEFGEFNILVNTVSPGRIYTERIEELDNIKAQKIGISVEEIRQQSENTIPLGRYGKTEEYGRVVAFIASDVASYINGSSLLIDGGMVKAL